MEASELVALASEALAVGDVRRAVEALRQPGHDPDPAAHELLGSLLLFDDDLVGARSELETAFHQWLDVGHRRAAALVAATLADVHTSWLGNRSVGHGWVERGRRLLASEPSCVEQGYLDLAVLACEAGDAAELEGRAAAALVLAREFGDSDLEVRARSDHGYALVIQGRVDDGFAELDEAMAALSAGEVRNPAVACMSFCALLAACERTGDLARAEEWTRVIAVTMTEPLGERPRAMHMHCRLVYGSVLCTSGRWSDGEAALVDALGARGSAIYAHRAEAATRLASLRLVQGRVAEAAELLRPFEDRSASCDVLARVHLAEGETDLAAAVARRGLDTAGTDLLRTSTLRSVLVEIELARDDVAAAQEHVEALEHLAASTVSRLIHADLALARGRVAALLADPHAAIAHLHDVARHVSADERPLLLGIASLELAHLYAEIGDRGAALDRARTASAVFTRLGATPLCDRTDALLRSLGAPMRSSARPSTAAVVARLTAREHEVLALLREGRTNAEVAQRLFISPKTAEHHVSRVLTKLGVRNRAEAAAFAAAAGVEAAPPAAG